MKIYKNYIAEILLISKNKSPKKKMDLIVDVMKFILEKTTLLDVLNLIVSAEILFLLCQENNILVSLKVRKYK